MGKIILIGGHVDIGSALSSKEKKELGRPKKIRMVRPEILERFLHEMKGKKSRVELITSASDIPFAIGYEYRRALKALGCSDVGIMHFRKSKEADEEKMLQRLAECDGVLFTGGSQVQLCEILGKTKFLAALKARFCKEKRFMIAGTSAGAMALGRQMIAYGDTVTSFVKGDVSIIKGLNLLPRIIVDTHFVQRRRMGRLIEAVAFCPNKLGIGLSENTAVFFESPGRVEIIGKNLVVLVDGTHITYNNINNIRRNSHLCLENVVLHILPKGHIFNITRRKILK